jgi:hypothetical protein
MPQQFVSGNQTYLILKNIQHDHSLFLSRSSQLKTKYNIDDIDSMQLWEGTSYCHNIELISTFYLIMVYNYCIYFSYLTKYVTTVYNFFLHVLFSELSENFKLSTIPFESIRKLTNLEELWVQLFQILFLGLEKKTITIFFTFFRVITNTNITTIPDFAFQGLKNLDIL